jgi:uncharacterized membrane protein
MEVSKSNWFAIVIISLVTFFGGFVRVLSVANRSIWLDENWSLLFASQPLGSLVQSVIQLDVHPPTYYILLRFWAETFGYTELSLRGLSIIFGTIAIPVFYILTREFFNRKNSYISTILFAVSPYAIEYAGEIRMYSLLLLLTITSYYLFLRFLSSDSNWWLIAYLSVSIFLIYTHIMALTVLAAQNAQYISRLWANKSFSNTKKWIGGQLTVGLTFIPWIWVVIEQAGKLSDKAQPPLPGVIDLIVLQHHFAGKSLIATSIFGFLFILGIIRWSVRQKEVRTGDIRILSNQLISDLRSNSGTLPIAFVWYTVPIILQFGFAYIIPRSFDYRHIIMSLPPLILIITFGISSINTFSINFKYRKYIPIAVALILVFSSIPAIGLIQSGNIHPNWEEGTDFVEQNANNDATIVFDAGIIQRQFTYYSDSDSQYTMYAYRSSHPLLPEQSLINSTNQINSDDQVWFITSHERHKSEFIQGINQTHELTLERDFNGLGIRRFDRRD